MRHMPVRILPVFCLLALLLASGCGQKQSASGDLEVVVTFDDVSGLEPGDEVRLRGLAIGKVSSMELGDGNVNVHVTVGESYRGVITSGTSFKMKRANPVLGGRFLEVDPAEGEPVKSGHIFEGERSLLGRISETMSGAKDLLGNAELRSAVEDFGSKVKDAAGQGREEWEKRKPGLEESAQKIVDLTKEKAPKVADWVKQRLQEIMDAGDDQFPEADGSTI